MTLESYVDMGLRAAAVYVAGFAMIRLGKNRLLGNATAFDIVLAIILGSLLSRAINGSAGLLETLVASGVLIVLHAVACSAAFRWPRLDRVINGKAVQLLKDGKVKPEELRRVEISMGDLQEALRLKGKTMQLDELEAAYLERNGQISVIVK